MKFKNTLNKLFIVSMAASVSITGAVLSAGSAFASDELSETESVQDEIITEAPTEESVEETTQANHSEACKEDATAETSGIPETSEEALEKSETLYETEKVKAEYKASEEESTSVPSGEAGSSEETSESNQDGNKQSSGVSAPAVKNAAAKLNGWKNISGKYYYYKDNVKYTGWHLMTAKEGEKTDHWSYFGSDGALRTGWVQLGKGTKEPDGNTVRHYSYFGDNGWLRTGWQQLGKGTNNPDGNTGKHLSYFGDNGWLRTGWVQLGKGTSEPDGNTNKHFSYFGDNGWLRTGWVQLGKGTSEPDGNTNRHFSYFGDNGWLRTGWQQIGKGTPNPDGNSAAHFSYFGDNGWLVTGRISISGKSYVFDSKGWLTQGSVSTSDANKNISPTLTSSASSTASQVIADGCYRISSAKNTAYSIDVWDESAADNTKIWSYANNSSAAQLFQIKHLGNNIYSIKTGASIYASALDISGGKAVSGAAVIQKKYTGSSTQKWKIVSAGSGYYTIKPASGNLALDIEGGNLSQGTIKLAASNGSATQKFKLTKASGFLFRNGRKYYFNQNGDKPMIGIDVSAWSENIDWDKAKADGIEFAIIRTSHRGGQIDKYGERNMKECTRLGIPFGVYNYSYAVTNAQADHEVDVMISTVKKYNPQLGLFIDVEDTSTYQAAFGNIYNAYARRKITDLTKRMVNRIQNAGYLAGVYANEGYFNNVLYMDEMPNARWVARYFDNNASDTNIINMANKGYKIWQFTSTGSVDGIPNKGDADLNTLLEKYW